MQRWIAHFVAGLWLLAPAVAGLGQDATPPGLFASCRAIRLEIVLGRIAVVPRHGGRIRIDSAADAPVRESLAVHNQPDAPWVRYEYSDALQSLTVEVENYRRVVIRSERSESESPCSWELQQPESGPLRWEVQDGEGRREITAASLWHLMFAERAWCEATLIPVLQRLRTSWQIGEMATRVEEELFRQAGLPRRVDRAEIEALVAELGSSLFQHRRLAAKRLYDYGPVVLPHLASLAASERRGEFHWNGEQRARVQEIQASLARHAPDTPARVAQWLADDEHVWLALMKDPDPQRRQLASVRLTSLQSREIRFDPYGDESHRQAQIAQLQDQLDRR